MDEETVKLLDHLAEHTLALVQNPEAPVHAEIGGIYRRLGRTDDALDLVRAGTRRHPSFAPGFALLGRLQRETGDAQHAAASLEKALALAGEDTALLFDLAQVRFQLGEEQNCRSLLERLLALDPAHLEGKALLERLGPEPKPEAGRGESSWEKKPFATATLAEIYVKQGYLNRALQVYEQLAAAAPESHRLQQRIAALRQQVSGQEESRVLPEEQESSSLPATALQGRSTIERAGLPAQENPDLRIVQELERWLRAIAQRRENVR